MPSDGPSDEKQIKLESTQSESSGADDGGGGGKAASVSAAGSSSGGSEVRNEYHMKKRKLR